ncbi:MAG: hypothetical protein H7061_07150 [Bdellovibrionaceae bacterium]|nr:hypothetical protein [Bdellovibrio sp.]
MISCQTATKVIVDYTDELGLHTVPTRQGETYFINIGFVCEPERDADYRKRTEKLVNQKVLALFYNANDKIVSQSLVFFDTKAILRVEVDADTIDQMVRVELRFKNKTIVAARERLSSPVRLPESICK